MVLRIATLFAFGACFFVALPAAAIEPTAVARMAEPSMVRIVVEGPPGRSRATGFVVSRDGHVATAYHVVQPYIEYGWNLSVLASDDAAATRHAVTVVHAFPDEDIAILEVADLDRPPIVLSDSREDAVSKGMTVFAIGFPGAGERLGADGGTSFTVGFANRIFTGRWHEDGPPIVIVQHSAATNPGNSGGPIVNPCGQVVGLNTQREMAMLITPTGMPIVYDVIQGVFFASHVTVLTEKLKGLGIAYNGSPKVCRIILGVASTNFAWYGLAAAAALLLLVAALVRLRPRRTVHVIVVGGPAPRTGLRRLGDRLRLLPGLRRRGGRWRLRCTEGEHGPIDIVISADDLRRAQQGVVIGRDPACDCSLPHDGVAGQHVRLVPLGEGLGVVDLQSDGGTAVDDRPVSTADGPAPLAPGARLRLGDVTFTVERV